MAEASAGLSALFEAHRAELLRFLTARTGDPAEAEDIAQELWLRAHRTDAGPIANGRAYLFRVAHNLVLDQVRERNRRAQRDRSWHGAEYGETAPGMELPDYRTDAERGLIEREEAALLASAIGNLPEGARRAFRLHKIDGLSHAEVASRLGISKSGVEKHIAVAMKHLRKMLGD
ncbi:RNA polymerase sigma factor [Sphingomonas tabacisoli]|uniref:RNA polymerase sigma factor n=1 Tax=Sphingomonas tabacisoli TaxID=2249466 RepID=A0ABW4I422_9SPHN